MRILPALLLALFSQAILAAPEDIAPNAPDRYTVVKGDTLWGISSRFLKQPWRWPEVWRMNRDQIRNPHRIYPGQVIVLDRVTGTLSMGEAQEVMPDGTVKLSPKVYSTPVDAPIASVPMEIIQPFLTQPLVVETEELPNPATIVAIQEDRVIAGNGDTVFAKNIEAGVDLWQIYRKAAPIRDPETNAILAYEAQYVSNARVTSPVQGGQATALLIEGAKQDAGKSDRLMPWQKADPMNRVPHAGSADVAGRVVAIYGGVGSTGRMGVITLGAGSNSGVETGQVYALYRNRGTVTYREEGRLQAETHRLPEERYGMVFVFRVFNRVSYALVLDATVPVVPGDNFRAP